VTRNDKQKRLREQAPTIAPSAQPGAIKQVTSAEAEWLYRLLGPSNVSFGPGLVFACGRRFKVVDPTPAKPRKASQLDGVESLVKRLDFMVTRLYQQKYGRETEEIN
jgi:hypothetical protein